MNKTLLAFCSFVCVNLAHAQTPVKVNMKPGLWEHSINVSDQGAGKAQATHNTQMKAALEKLQKEMANLTPEQRKLMEQAMGIQVTDEGLNFDGGTISATKDGTRVTNCVTQEQIDRGEMLEADDGCKASITQLDKKRFKSKQTCEHFQSEAILEFHSPTHYTGKGKSTHTIDGKTNEMTIDLAGKWLSADCKK